MQEPKRGKHERERRSLIEALHLGRDAAVRRLRGLPSIVTRERVLIGKERA
jgi:hypothetical protein